MNADAGTAWVARGLRIVFGVLGAVALVWIPLRSEGIDSFPIVNYLSYFTVESAAFGVLVLLIGGLRDPRGRRWQLIRGASTLYLLTTGMVYVMLLADSDVMLADRWINDVLHGVLPLVLVADWMLGSGRERIGPAAGVIGAWLAYPTAYGAYTLIRGLIVGWYPYPFLDPRQRGYVSLITSLVALICVFVFSAVAVAAVCGMLRRRVGNTRSGRGSFAADAAREFR
ncbi:Pr6Pr family membrane protein [Nocardia sp. NPDC049220]|uniref:Pr6Pr family membrane protein n=1 Tax=Nocardia sp. NPDC049220 TaxID=3155273 RepID=UPI0033F3E29C